MPNVVVLDIKVTIPAAVEPAADQPNKWASGLVHNATIINERRIAKLGDEGTFNALVATPSSAGFAPMIDAAFVSKSGRNQANIVRAHYKNLSTGFNKYNDKLDLMFATVDGVPAKRFVDQVNNSKDNWATRAGAKTLRSTGDRIRGLLLPQVIHWMVADPRASQMTNAMTIIAGAPYNFVAEGLLTAFKAGFMGKLTHALMTILNADYNAAEILAQNTELAAFCTALEAATVKPFVAGGVATDSLADFEYIDPTLVFHARVVEV